MTFNIPAIDSDDISSVVWDAAGVNEPLTLVDATTSSLSSGDRHEQTWARVNPTAKTGDITISGTGIDDSTTAAVNYSGTKTASVAEATNLIAEDVDDTGSATFDIANGGTSGNLLFTAAGFRGDDQDPVSLSEGWSEVAEVAPSSGADNAVLKMADKAAPSAITMTPQVTDEYAGNMIEIVAAPGQQRCRGSSVGLMSVEPRHRFKDALPAALRPHALDQPAAQPNQPILALWIRAAHRSPRYSRSGAEYIMPVRCISKGRTRLVQGLPLSLCRAPQLRPSSICHGIACYAPICRGATSQKGL